MRLLPDLPYLRLRAEESVSALPDLMIAAEKLADTIVHGDHAQRKSGAGQKFWQYREYVPGDRPQDIDWRQSAKTDHVFVKQKEWQITRKTYFWCARGASMNFSSAQDFPSKQDYARIMTLALALVLRKTQEQLGIFGSKMTGRSEGMMEKIGHYVLDDVENPLPHDGADSLPQNAYFIGMGDFLSPIEEIEVQFSHIAARTQNALILQILDPAELSLSYNGRVRFVDMAGSENHIIQNVSAVRAAYQERIEAHCKSVRNLCEGHGWSYHLCPADVPMASTLQDLYVMLDQGTRG